MANKFHRQLARLETWSAANGDTPAEDPHASFLRFVADMPDAAELTRYYTETIAPAMDAAIARGVDPDRAYVEVAMTKEHGAFSTKLLKNIYAMLDTPTWLAARDEYHRSRERGKRNRPARGFIRD